MGTTVIEFSMDICFQEDRAIDVRRARGHITVIVVNKQRSPFRKTEGACIVLL